MKKIYRIFSILLVSLMLVSMMPVMAQTELMSFTLLAEGAEIEVNAEKSEITLTYPDDTKKAAFRFEAAIDTYCLVYADPERSLALTPDTAGMYNIAPDQKYTYLYISIQTGDETQLYDLTIIANRPTVQYTDCDSIPDWSLPYIDFCNRSGYGFIKGDTSGNINPLAELTRYETATIAARIMGVDCALYADVELPYEDTIVSWAYAAVAAITELGIIDGSLNNGKLYFEGNTPISREQVAKIMTNIFLLKDSEGQTAEGLYEQNKQEYDQRMALFTDNADISPWAVPYMAVAVNHFGFLEGEEVGKFTYLRPVRNISRQEMIAVIAREYGYHIDTALQIIIEDATQALIDIPNRPTNLINTLNSAIKAANTALNAITNTEKLSVYADLYKVLNEYLRTRLVYLSPERRVTNTYTGVNTNESAQMYAVAELIKPQLEALGYTVHIADIALTINDRGAQANEMGADIYVSIHSNAAGGPNNGSAQGSIIFHSNNPGSKRLAELVSAKLSAITPTVDQGIRNDSEDKIPFAEIQIPQMANILAEVEFHDYATYAQWIVNNKSKIAKAFVDAIHEYFQNN